MSVGEVISQVKDACARRRFMITATLVVREGKKVYIRKVSQTKSWGEAIKNVRGWIKLLPAAKGKGIVQSTRTGEKKVITARRIK